MGTALIERQQAEAALRDSQDRLQRVLDALPMAAYTCDVDGLITYFNACAVDLWGRSPRLGDSEDRFCGSFRLFLPDGSPLSHDRSWTAIALAERRAIHRQETVIERPDGSRRTALAHASPLYERAGRLTGAVNVLVDITERKAKPCGKATSASSWLPAPPPTAYGTGTYAATPFASTTTSIHRSVNARPVRGRYHGPSASTRTIASA
ncbi:MAG: PAS domain S-box protein [Pseudomonadota bacterium]|nr:PAS domain S-box protein [Pseudomonadota bacterium]